MRNPGRQVRRQIFRSGITFASATHSGTVKMVVQGRQMELTPSIKEYAEDKVIALTPRCGYLSILMNISGVSVPGFNNASAIYR